MLRDVNTINWNKELKEVKRYKKNKLELPCVGNLNC